MQSSHRLRGGHTHQAEDTREGGPGGKAQQQPGACQFGRNVRMQHLAVLIEGAEGLGQVLGKIGEIVGEYAQQEGVYIQVYFAMTESTALIGVEYMIKCCTSSTNYV